MSTILIVLVLVLLLGGGGKETFVFTQSGTADYRLRVSLLLIPVGEAHLTVQKRPG